MKSKSSEINTSILMQRKANLHLTKVRVPNAK